jgi:hypothetical protein
MKAVARFSTCRHESVRCNKAMTFCRMPSVLYRIGRNFYGKDEQRNE